MQHGSASTRTLSRLRVVFSTRDVRVPEGFTSAMARAGGEENSPQDQFVTWPTHRPSLSRISTVVMPRGTVIPRSLTACRVSVLILSDSGESSR